MTTKLEIDTDRSQKVSFDVSLSGSVSSTDFRLRIESGLGYDLQFSGTSKNGTVSFDIPKISGLVSEGSRSFIFEMIADKEAYFSPLQGTIECKKTLKVEAKASVERTEDSKIQVKVVEASSVKKTVDKIKENVLPTDLDLDLDLDF